MQGRGSSAIEGSSRLSDESVEASVCLKDWYDAGDRATALKISTDQDSSDELTTTPETED